jgi:hypothetical protein
MKPTRSRIAVSTVLPKYFARRPRQLEFSTVLPVVALANCLLALVSAPRRARHRSGEADVRAAIAALVVSWVGGTATAQTAPSRRRRGLRRKPSSLAAVTNGSIERRRYHALGESLRRGKSARAAGLPASTSGENCDHAIVHDAIIRPGSDKPEPAISIEGSRSSSSTVALRLG